MFNEKSGKWIKIYKGITVALFFVFIVFGMVAGIGDASCSFFDIDLGGDIGLFDFLIWVVLGSFVGYVQLVFNMLIIQLLNNVQIIREKNEKD